MAVKKEMVFYSDIGIIGAFVGWERHPSEEDYVYLRYVPMNSFTKQVIKYEKPIPTSAIHTLNPVVQVKGVPERIILIYTAEEGSIAKRAMETKFIIELEEAKAKAKSLEMKNATLTQELENARAGVSKSLSSVRSLARKSDDTNQSQTPLSLGGRTSFDRLRRQRLLQQQGGDGAI